MAVENASGADWHLDKSIWKTREILAEDVYWGVLS